MPQEKSPSGIAAEARELFTEVIKEGEELKVKVGQTVFLNDSDVGKPQDRLTDEMLSSIKNAVLQDNGDRINIPLTDNGNPKTPEIEVVAVSGKGKAGERLLFRQEKGLAVSVNEVADLAQQRSTEVAQPEPTKDEAVQKDAIDQSNQALPDSQADPPILETPEAETSSEPLVTPNAVETLKNSVEKLPESQTKALWQRVAADFQQLNAQLKGIHQKNKEIVSAVTEAPKAIKQDTEVLIQQARQQLATIQQNLQTKVKQTSLDDIASAAIRGSSLAVDAASKGLGRASHYLKDRADKVKSYGMAKAALRVYDKGHERTGESIFKAEGYTVEAVTNGYEVKDHQNRSVMSFATDSKGKPISVTTSASIQPADYKKLNQVSKLPVIEGSPEAEAAYSKRIARLAEGVKLAVPEGGSRNGPNFFVSREDDRITVATQEHPRKELIVDPSNGSQSNLTIADMDRLENSIAKAIELQNYREELLNQKPEQPEKLSKVGIEIG